MQIASVAQRLTAPPAGMRKMNADRSGKQGLHGRLGCPRDESRTPHHRYFGDSGAHVMALSGRGT